MNLGLGDFTIDPWLIVVVAISVVVFGVVTVIWGIRAHRLQVGAGREELVGKTAEVRVALEPKGTVFIDGEQWSAVAEAGRAEPGEEVIITRVDGLKLYVTKK
ncbi:MAG: NfeD family protein [Dehalococcoidales bacterium]|jgi:membrane-bound ClpP family serine protease|nr:serine protease [Dehalococcoidales bacterium]MDP6127225.1 NfeD family protein [Dehalococcoidales bacterium]MDP7525085.1 NfeD family protein [Dehalococcoidales bacterium]|tara:strand:- start:394 stop:702 length:309 start_codon:yes stop_codon:yes gene_type:complete